MRTITKIGIGAAVLLANVAAHNLAGAQSYPRLSGSGDEAVVEYGPPRRAISSAAAASRSGMTATASPCCARTRASASACCSARCPSRGA